MNLVGTHGNATIRRGIAEVLPWDLSSPPGSSLPQRPMGQMSSEFQKKYASWLLGSLRSILGFLVFQESTYIFGEGRALNRFPVLLPRLGASASSAVAQGRAKLESLNRHLPQRPVLWERPPTPSLHLPRSSTPCRRPRITVPPPHRKINEIPLLPHNLDTPVLQDLGLRQQTPAHEVFTAPIRGGGIKPPNREEQFPSTRCLV